MRREPNINRMAQFKVDTYPTLRLYKGSDGSFVQFPMKESGSNFTEQKVMEFLNENGV